MPASDSPARDLGRHDAEIIELQRQVAMLAAEVHGITLTLAEARGSWKVLVGVAGFSGAIGAVLAKLPNILS